MTVTGFARVVGSKLLATLPVLFAVSLLTFGAMDLIPGDPVIAILGNSATAETSAALAEQLGLNRPWFERYLTWLGAALQGDLGTSFLSRVPVSDLIGQRLLVTTELLIFSQIIALVVAIPVTVWGAYRPGRKLDRAATVSSFVLISLPPFVVALVLSYVFASLLGWFPTAGFTPLFANPLENLRSLLLPSLALAAGSAPVYSRILRADMRRTLEQDFILVAKAKGMTTGRILLGHALKPSSFSLITVIGLTLGSLIGGALVVEIIFGIPGIGRLLFDAINRRDYIVVQGVVAFIALVYVLVNLLVDILYILLDPRVRNA